MPNPYPIRVTAQDGVTELSGEAAFTDPANQPGGGGSQSLVDLGTIHVVDLLTGPVTLTTPAVGTFCGIFAAPDGFVNIDSSDVRVQVVPATRAAVAGVTAPLLTWDRGTGYGDALNLTSGLAFAVSGIADGAAIRAYLATTLSNGYVVMSALAAWQANHAYPAAITLILGADGHIWSQDLGGMSGGIIPDFASNEGGTVADGGVTWADEGAAPTVGALHLYALVASI